MTHNMLIEELLEKRRIEGFFPDVNKKTVPDYFKKNGTEYVDSLIYKNPLLLKDQETLILEYYKCLFSVFIDMYNCFLSKKFLTLEEEDTYVHKINNIKKAILIIDKNFNNNNSQNSIFVMKLEKEDELLVDYIEKSIALVFKILYDKNISDFDIKNNIFNKDELINLMNFYN